jgi:hypothetical protein
MFNNEFKPNKEIKKVVEKEGEEIEEEDMNFFELKTTSDTDPIVVFFPNFNEITRRQRNIKRLNF